MACRASRPRVLRASLLSAVALAALGPAAAGAATYYVAPNGSDAGPGSLGAPWRTIQKAANSVVAGDTVLLRTGTYRERVVIAVAGAAGAEVTFAAYPGEAPVVDGANLTLPDAMAGLVEVTHAAYVRVRGLRVINARPHLDNAGILVKSSHHVVVERNATYNTVSSGIGVWKSDTVTVDGNDVALACNDGLEESITIGETSSFQVTRNVVHGGGPATRGGQGINVKDGSRAGKVFANHVFGLRSVGIYVDAWDAPTDDIEVYGNVVHDVSEGIALGAEAGGLLANVRVHDNVVYRAVDVGLIVWAAGPAVVQPMSDLWLVNNTLHGNGTSGWGGGIAIQNPDATGVVVRNNVVSRNAFFQIVVEANVPAASVTIDHNLVDGFRGWLATETRGSDFVEGDPRFADAASHDLHLRPGSPAIDRAVATTVSTRDIEGLPRPQGAAPDLGAYEYPAPAPLLFYTVNPCRLVDTRDPDLGGPAPLAFGDDVVFVLAGRCGIPASAKAVSLNVTVTAPTAAGHLRLYAADRTRPLASTINFVAGRTRANDAVVPLDAVGALRVYVGLPQGTVHVILDTNGYFEQAP